MPFYEYRCDACAFQDSFLESMNASAQKTCPECGKRRAFKRLISAAGFQLKGSGWYVTDFRDNDKKKPSEKKTEAATDSATSADKKSDAKGETKSDAKSSDSKKSDRDSGAKSSANKSEKTEKKNSKR